MRVIWRGIWAWAGAPFLGVCKNQLYESSSGQSVLILLGEHSSDQPEVVSEHPPGDGKIAVSKSAASQSFCLTLLENGDACFGRASAALQRSEARLFHAISHSLGIERADRIVYFILPEPARSAL